MPPWLVVELLALHYPNIVRLYLGMLLLTEFDLPDDRKPPRSQVDVHPSLREIDLGFTVNRGAPFPREHCKKVLRLLTEVCPALEVVRFGYLFFADGVGIDERNVQLDRVMDMRRTAEGEWKERVGGVVTPI